MALTYPSAGSTDSSLTTHGLLQATRLGAYLADGGFKFTHIFASDLSRAWKTAETILAAQADKTTDLKITQSPLIREQDFGHYEKKPFSAKPKASYRARGQKQHKLHPNGTTFKEVESKDALAFRANKFLDILLLPILRNESAKKSKSREEPVVAVISHGILLGCLWRCLLKRFALYSVDVLPSINPRGETITSLEHICGWSNTGYLNLKITKAPIYPRSPKIADAIAADHEENIRSSSEQVLYDWRLEVRATNCREHLRGLKRIGGGVGSSRLDERQKTIETYFKRHKLP